MAQLLVDEISTTARGGDRKHGSSCRFCGMPLRYTFLDLGMSPLANSYLSEDQLGSMETFYPLHAYVCGECFLVQLQEFEKPEQIFGDYAYFSSYSDTWLRHAEAYVDMAIERFGLDERSRVVEIASNDGYLLQYFVASGIPSLGIEPAANVAAAAIARDIPTRTVFFGRETARNLVRDGFAADLIIANNVLAHVPDLNDFVGGLPLLMRPGAVATLEFPHLLRLMRGHQFDTIYHEHFSYFSFSTVERIFAAHGLILFDVEELPTHGGSLRIYARHAGDDTKPITARVHRLRNNEETAGLIRLDGYRNFAASVQETKRHLLSFLIAAKNAGKSVVAYGAPAKGNTLLNYCGIRADLIDYTVDRSPHKQGRYLPGTHIPIRDPGVIAETKPDFVLILPWNLRQEVMAQMAHIRKWGGRFVVPIPQVVVYP